MEKAIAYRLDVTNEPIPNPKDLHHEGINENRMFFCKLFVEKGPDGFYLAGELLSESRARRLSEFFSKGDNRQFLPFNVSFFKAKKGSSFESIVNSLFASNLLLDMNSSSRPKDLIGLNNRLFPLLFQAVETDENVLDDPDSFSIYSFQNGRFFTKDPKLKFSLINSDVSLDNLLNSILKGLPSLTPFQPKDFLSGNVDQIFSLNVGQASCTYGVLNCSKITSSFFDVGFEKFTSPSKFKTAQGIYKQVQPGGFVVLSHFDTDHFLGAAFSTSKNPNLFLKTWIIPDLSSLNSPQLLLSSLSLSAILLLASLFSVPNPSIFWLTTNGQWAQIANNVYVQNASGKGRNNSGIVSYVIGQDGLLFIPGDADYQYWPSTPGPITAMVVPHHGSYSQIPPSVNLSKTFKSIIYAGRNTYGHPSLCSLVDLDAHGCQPIWRFRNDFILGLGLKAYCGTHFIVDPFSRTCLCDFFLFFK